MTWIKTESAKFIKDEVVGVQYLATNYSRTNAELILFFRGGGEMKFIGEEADVLWERFGNDEEETRE